MATVSVVVFRLVLVVVVLELCEFVMCWVVGSGGFLLAWVFGCSLRVGEYDGG